MKIELELDDFGKPYISVLANEDEVADKLLEHFIRAAKENGLFAKNESSFETLDDCISIRVNSTKPHGNDYDYLKDAFEKMKLVSRVEPKSYDGITSSLKIDDKLVLHFDDFGKLESYQILEENK